MTMDAKDKWFHGNISREEAEDLVRKAKVNGSFVVRSSRSVKGAYAISLLHCGNVHTYRILATPEGKFAVQTSSGVQNRKFLSVDDLVEEYRAPKNGLVCALTNPVGRISAVPALPERNVVPTAPKNVLPSYFVVESTPEVVEESIRNCVICMDSVVNTFFQPCGHVCCCMDCSAGIRQCPLCRIRITKFQKAYLS
ncbi:SH2 domain-containing protein 1A-like [Styela clava]|uniref:phosphatidylinositol 3,4,5-trisphosphate 5-phosphatase 1-like n=1 Tax=Styela clava TaxID=7725 RepID=UPI00193A37DD|nr:phosphatidylinositol 3,4,5-trisphosphate 5-phosphatase 1-like [Styela clava]